MHPVTALQSEYSISTRDQDELRPVLRERGIGLVACLPLGRGFRAGPCALRRPGEARRHRLRTNHPCFTGENFRRTLRIADRVQQIADQIGATPAQGDDIVPIPGTKQVGRVGKNTAADAVELTAEQVAALTALPPAEGGHHAEAQMKLIER